MPQVRITKVSSAKVHTGAIYTLLRDAQAPDSFYSAGGDGNIVRWHLSDMTNPVKIAHVQAVVLSLLLLPKRKELVAGQMQGGIHVLGMNEKKETKHLAYHQRGVFDLQYDDKRKRIIACGGDGVLSFWDNEYSLLKAIQLSENSIRNIAFNPAKQLLATGCSDNSVYVINCDDLHIQHRLQEHQNSVFAVCFSPDGKYLLTGSRDAHLRIWDAANGFHPVKTIPAHLFTINCIAYSTDGKYFATASRDKTIKLWSAESFELLKVIDKEKYEGHINSVNKLIWMNGNLVSGSDDRNVIVWKVDEDS